MQVNRGHKTDITAGDRKSIFCEGGNDSLDVIFYKTILGANANKFEFKPIGSSNTIPPQYVKTTFLKSLFALSL